MLRRQQPKGCPESDFGLELGAVLTFKGDEYIVKEVDYGCRKLESFYKDALPGTAAGTLVWMKKWTRKQERS
jgi:hypothetical protein